MRNVLLVIACVMAFFGLLTYFTVGGKKYRVEVCMEFQGRSNCRTASASSKQQALRTATENACATISSGVTDTIGCDNTPPATVKWLN